MGVVTYSTMDTVWRAPTRTPANGRLAGLLAVALGLFACWWPLSVPAATADARGFAVTTAGITALFLAARANRAGFPRLASVGVLLGLAGTFLCAWSLIAFNFTDIPIPPVPSLSNGLVPAASEPFAPPVGLGSPTGRVVPPIDGADIASMPEGQLRANLRHVVFNLAGGLGYSQQQGTLPAAVLMAPDGTVYYDNVTLSAVPFDMVLAYTRAPDGLNFTIRVSDSVSGMAVSADSATGAVVDE